MFGDIYPYSRFESTYGTGEKLLRTKARWIDSEVSNFSFEVIKAAIKYVEHHYDWPPTISEFYKACRELGATNALPDVETAYHDACMKPQGDLEGALRVVVDKTGSWELRTRSREYMFPIFKRNYEIIKNRILKGEKIEAEIPVAIEHQPMPSHTEAEIKNGRAEFLRIKEELFD